MKGVIHVGAHEGEEVEQYLREGRAPIICFEPQILPWAWGGVRLVNSALSDRAHVMTLHVPKRIAGDGLDTQAASGLLLIPERARALGWTPTKCEEIKVPAIRFDNWAELSGFLHGLCELLVIDAQGMGMQVLRGFGDWLDDFAHVIVECAEEPVWIGEASSSEIESFMSTRGFRRSSPIVACGDVHYDRI